jgi:Rho termination factor, N-terminal domain
MAAPNRPQPQRNGHPPRRRIVDTIRATLGRGRAAVSHMRPTNRRVGKAPRQADATGKHTPGRLRSLRERSVAGIRQLAGQTFTTTRSLPARAGRQLNRLTRHGHDAAVIRAVPGIGEPADRTRTARNRRKAAATSVGRGGGRGPGTAEHATPTERRHFEPAKERGRVRQTKQRQARPRQAKRRQDLQQQTVQELRKQAREAGIKGRSSMTKDQLIEALHDRR